MSTRSWVDGEWLAFDIESTGVDTALDRIVTASLLRVTPQAVVQEWEWLANPGVPIPLEAQAIHGVSTERAQREGAPAAEVVASIAETLTDQWCGSVPLVVCNAPYDLSLLDAELRRHHGRRLNISGRVLDPLACDRALDKYRPGRRTLTALCKHYQVDLIAAHTSVADALAAAEVMRRIAEVFPGFRHRTLDQVHYQQVVWYAQWAQGYQVYLRNKMAAENADPHEIAETVIDHQWPVRIPVEGPMRVGGRQR